VQNENMEVKKEILEESLEPFVISMHKQKEVWTTTFFQKYIKGFLLFKLPFSLYLLLLPKYPFE